MNSRSKLLTVVYSLILLFGGLGANAFAYSGMSASVAQSKKGWNESGNIVIAIMKEDVIVSEDVIYSGGDGYCPRFSPDGKKVAFTANGAKALKICNIDGSDLKEYPASGWEVSWLRSGVIWIHGGRWSKSDVMNKYDAATGKHLAMVKLQLAMQQYYVAANGKVGAGTGPSLKCFYNTVDGNDFGEFIQFADGCSAGPTPEGDYSVQNTWPHRVFHVWKIPEKKRVATMDINKASEVGLDGSYIWNHQLNAQHSNVIVQPVGHGGGNQLGGNQYPCFYDIDEKKLIWMTKTKPGGELLTHPYDFYKLDGSGNVDGNAAKSNPSFIKWFQDFIPAKYPGTQVISHEGGKWYQSNISKLGLTASWAELSETSIALKAVEGLREGKAFFIVKGSKEKWANVPSVVYYEGLGYYIPGFNSATMGDWEVGKLTVVQFDGDSKKFSETMAKTWISDCLER